MTSRTSWRSVGKALYVLAVAIVMVWALWQGGSQISAWRAWAGEPGIYAFIACWILMAFLLGLAWAQILRAYLGWHLPLREWLPIQAAAWAGRYLPGKVGLLAGKLVLVRRRGLAWKSVGFSVLFEQVAFVVIGIALALLATWPAEALALESLQFIAGDSARLLRWAFALVLCLALFPVMGLVARRAGALGHPGAIAALGLAGIHLAAQLLAGVGFHFALQPFLVGAGPHLMYSISLLAAANVAGILALFAPAGLGVREAVLTVGLAPYLSLESALAFAALLRILTLVADGLFCTLGGGVAVLRRAAR